MRYSGTDSPILSDAFIHILISYADYSLQLLIDTFISISKTIQYLHYLTALLVMFSNNRLV